MRCLNRKKAIILTYHGFADKGAEGRDKAIRPLYLDIKRFKSQMEYLKRYYNVISLGRLIEHYTTGAELPPNPLVVTIDDGYKTAYTLAYPVLKQFNIPATIFLATDFIDKKEMLWPDRIEYAIDTAEPAAFQSKIGNEILSFDCRNNGSKKVSCAELCSRLKMMPGEKIEEAVESLERILGEKLSLDKERAGDYFPLEWHEVLEMARSGIISIGSHTSSHAILTRCNLKKMERELVLSRQLIEEKTGLECRLFSYPNGEAGDFDNRTKELLGRLGYSCGLTTVSGMNDEQADIFELKRLHINSNVDLILFTMILSGVFKFFVDIKQSISYR